MSDSGPAEKIDEGLYSRQLYVLGFDAMNRMRTTDILLLGLRGLGVEIAKNLILTGVKSVTIHDDEPATYLDLSSQFFLSPSDIGKPRARCCLEKLRALNNYVQVNLHEGNIEESLLKQFQVVVATHQPLELMLRVNDFCHRCHISFISSEIHGVFANIFCDFGDEFIVNDVNGETPQSLIVASITQENPGIVTVVDDHRIPFEDGEWVTFSEIQGMTELNGSQPRKIKLLSQYTFSIENTTDYSPYKGGGYVTQVKQPSKIQFLSLRDSLENPEFLISDFAKMDRAPQLHLGFHALHIFRQNSTGHSLPLPHNTIDAERILKIISDLNDKAKSFKVEKIDESLMKQLSFGAMGEISPMTAFIGGIVAQEVLKACSGKFFPIKQWFYFDATEVLPSEDLAEDNFQPIGLRYDGNIVCLGKALQEAIQRLHYFLVGAGAIGCEVLKIWAMLGLGNKGHIHVTDMDIIEKSNLSRQFLFRPKDVEQLKSTTAANAVKAMNPELNITSYSLRVGPETESSFNDHFYQRLNGVCNALDNVEARLYMDSQCVFYRKPLLESGTLGTKGNTQVIVPNLTESYASSRDPPEKSIPICTLHHFPNTIDHTIQWARDIFEGLFKNQIESVNSYISNPNFIDSLQKQPAGTKLEVITQIKNCLMDEKPLTFDDCILWARRRFEDYFNNNIQQLLFNFPPDMITSNGTPFWSGPKRAPKVIRFDIEDPLHLAFIVSAANLRAQNFGIKGERDISSFREVLKNISLPEFSPKRGVKISTNEQEEKNRQQQEQVADDEDESFRRILSSLPSPSNLSNYRLNPTEFEKDDDTNFHIDFITAAANLRASNYSIPLTDKHKCKGIAGKIIPAMVTTTAVVSGLVCLELIKIMQNKPLDSLKNGFVNLALPFFGFSEPIAPPKTKIRENWSWSLWDRFDVEGELTLQQFLNYFKEKHQLELTMISCGACIIYSFFMPKDKLAERLPKKVSEVVQNVSKLPLPPSKNSLTMEICCNRMEDDAEVDVPYVHYIFKP